MYFVNLLLALIECTCAVLENVCVVNPVEVQVNLVMVLLKKNVITFK